MGTDTHVPEASNQLRRGSRQIVDDFSLLGLREQQVLNASDIPMLLVKGGNSDPVVVWGNRAFYVCSGFTGSAAGQTLSQCKITLRHENDLTGEVVRWSPLARGFAPDDTSRYGNLKQNSAHFTDHSGLASLAINEPENVWTCDFETASGQWIISQACVSPVQVVGAGPREKMWLVQILPAGESSVAQALLENSAASALDALSEISTLLTDVEHPNILRGIADILVEATPARWAGFFLGERTFTHSDGIVAAPHLEASDDLSQIKDVRGEVLARVMSGQENQAVEFHTDHAYSEGSLSFDLQRALLETWQTDAFEQQGIVTVQGIQGRDRMHGVLVCAYPSFNPLAEDFSLLDVSSESLKVSTTVSRRVGMAIDNVRLYQREHRLAQTLQQAMLPTQVDIKGLDVWTYYAPSSDHAKVGGDWYDILTVDQDTVGIVVGDVVGHDLEAAATMGQLRSITLPYAFEISNPEQVLEKVDRLVSRLSLSRQASMVYARMSKSGPTDASGQHRWSMEYSRAGHLPPILVRDGVGQILSGGAGTLIGFTPGARRGAQIELAPHDTLVFYTDGLIERRNRPMQAGLAELQRAVGKLRGDTAATIGEELLGVLGDEPEDDVAMVIVRVPGADEGTYSHGRLSHVFEYDPHPASVSRARHALAQVCQQWGLPRFAAAELVVSELVANAIKHGWGPVVLRLTKLPHAIRVEVEDSNPSGPHKLNGHADRGGGFGIKIVDRLSTWGWRETHDGKVIFAEVPLENRLDSSVSSPS